MQCHKVTCQLFQVKIAIRMPFIQGDISIKCVLDKLRSFQDNYLRKPEYEVSPLELRFIKLVISENLEQNESFEVSFHLTCYFHVFSTKIKLLIWLEPNEVLIFPIFVFNPCIKLWDFKDLKSTFSLFKFVVNMMLSTKMN